MYFDQIITIDQLESRLEEINEQVKRKNQENESLKKELDELKQSQVDHDSHIKKLEDQLSAKDAQIQCLTEQLDLRGSISDSSCEDECFNTLTDTSIPIEESNPVFENLQNGGVQVTSLDASYYSNSPCPSRKRSCSDVTQLIKVMIHVIFQCAMDNSVWCEVINFILSSITYVNLYFYIFKLHQLV